MRKLLNRPWFVALLATSAVVLCTFSLREPSGSTRPKVRSAVAVMPPEAAKAVGTDVEHVDSPKSDVAKPSIAAIVAALEFPANIPDPFARRGAMFVAAEPRNEPAQVLPDERESIELTAVWQQGATRLALVNNRILRAGDQLGRVVVDEITIDGIWVSHWKGRDFVAFGGAFTLLTPVGGQPALALHEN